MKYAQRTWAQWLVIPFLLLQLAIPAVSRAETANLRAGFAQGAIWMSRAHVVAGESVTIFTVLYNSSENSISGDTVLEVDGSPIGTKSFTLASGETQIVSLPWISKVGSHSISARMEKVLDANTNTDAAISDRTTGNITVSISASPPPSPTAQVLNTVTSAIQTGVASTAPAVLSAANSLYNNMEYFRLQAKAALEKQLAENTGTANAKQTKAGILNNPSGAGASTTNTHAETPLLSNTLRYMAAAGLATVSSRTLFYISLALLLLLLIQILRVSLREKRRSGRRLPLD